MNNKVQLTENILVVIKGAVIGVANIIPGVSGGTLAVILGIYDRLIEAISEFFTNGQKRIEYIFFLTKIFVGAAAAILLLANLMEYLLENHFQKTMFLFMGLIIGGVPTVVRSHGDMRIKATRIFSFLLGMLIVLGLAIISSHIGAKETAVQQMDVPTLTAGVVGMLFLSGFLAGGAMIVPGVSGSFILVLLGQYALVITLIKEMAVKPLALVGLGAATGIMVFSKIIETCLKKIPSQTYYFIMGLIFASLYVIFPGMPEGFTSIVLCSAAFIIGAIVSFLLSKL